jgi:hypothetical protein
VVTTVIWRERNPRWVTSYWSSRTTNDGGKASKVSGLSQSGQVRGLNHSTSWSSVLKALIQRERGSCPSRKPEAVTILDFFLTRPHPGPMLVCSFHRPS